MKLAAGCAMGRGRAIIALLALPCLPLTLWAQTSSIYAASLLKEKTTAQSGFREYRERQSTMDGVEYPHSLLTEVGNARPDEQISTLTFQLGGTFEQFLATVGRDDTETVAGPGYAYFEVWGDDKRLFKSTAIRSGKFFVRPAPGANTRKAAQEVVVSVRGVSVLQLITRYASDFTQEASLVARAKGCVWGDARLTPASGTFPRPANPTGKIERDPFRVAVRPAAIQLAAQTIFSVENTTPPRSLPLRLGVAPLRYDKGLGLPLSESDLRRLVADLLQAARKGDGEVFKMLGRREASRLANDAPTTRSSDESPVVEAARKAGADVVVVGTILARREGDTTWQVELHTTDTTNGALLGRTVFVLPAKPLRR